MSHAQQRYEALVRAYTPDLYRYAYWLCHSKSIAEDLVQDTLLRAWKNLSQLQEAKAAKAWLLTILRHENARRFERKQFEYSDVEQDSLEDLHQSPEQSVATDRLHRLILGLPQDYREPLVMQLLLGMTGDEIATVLQLNLNTVNTRLFRGRAQLRARLQPEAAGVPSHG
ncbi:sigma-70 family RNA polymerase sigma factor [Rheinheimera texasensis]|uniref:sigma-70 family RNA polymerase sigma factor n=1 Tax=Rheinheimera texasensis TaxID=306205 RepID=UPI0006922B0A|nr:sigma-70 family RNA polymerase sigma factor [Rheinheimera texasensis]